DLWSLWSGREASGPGDLLSGELLAAERCQGALGPWLGWALGCAGYPLAGALARGTEAAPGRAAPRAAAAKTEGAICGARGRAGETPMVARVCRPKRAKTSASHAWAAMRQLGQGGATDMMLMSEQCGAACG
ncbi:hypothetical protein T492DRAFT_875811, partial [Pavlovales sp. CCMP2436]